jgi:AcrR family transcriptional regulator
MSSRDATTSRAAPDAELSSARESFEPGQIGQIQRARLLAATVQAADAHGVANLTVADVVTRAGVSRRTFYEIFHDCEDCLLATLQDTVARATAPVLSAYEAERGGWRERIRAGLVALLAFFDEQPSAARLLVVEWPAAGPRALERRRRLLARLASAIEEGQSARRPGGAAVGSALMAEGIVGGVASVLHARLLDSRSSESRGAVPARGRGDLRMVELANPLMAMIVQPYLGSAAARKEFDRALPAMDAERDGSAPASEDALIGLNMRLTYRTMRVINAVAAHPGGSNRVIARAADIGDQGQISKLLMRLRKLGLVENRAVPVKGEPNAWFLSANGERVERLLRS